LKSVIPALLATLALSGVSGPSRALDPDKRFHHYVRDQWSIEQGLPQSSVQAITQDRTGYIWVGTQAGLARFDGVAFRNFTPENSPELPGMMVHSLLALDDGSLLIGTYRGLARHRDGRLEAVPTMAGPELPATPDIHQLVRFGDAGVFAATGIGLMRYQEDALRPVARLETRPTLSLATHDGALWVGATGAVLRFDGSAAVRYPLGTGEDDNGVIALAEHEGELWAGTQRGLFRLRSEHWERFHGLPELASLPIDALFVDRRGSLWIGTVAGLARLRGGRVVDFVRQGDPGAIPSVRAMFQDREGNLWFGSQWQGLNRLWNGFASRYSRPEGLHMVVVWSLARDERGRLWVGTGDGVALLENGRFRHIVRGSELPHPDGYTLLVEGDRVWIGTRGGVALYEGGAVTRPSALAGVGNAQINSILRDGEGALWLGTSGGLFRERDGNLRRFAEADGLPDPRVRVLLESPDGTLLIGSQYGLHVYDAGRLRALTGGGLPPDIDVTALHHLDDGLLVVGTLNEGLFLGDGERWLDVAGMPGIPANSPFFISHDGEDQLWVAGMRGVFRLPLAALRARLAGQPGEVAAEVILSERGDHRGGQKVHCCNGAGNAKGLMHEDVLWLPTRDGVIALPARNIQPERLPPTPVVEGVRSLDQWHSGAAGGPVVLPARGRDLTIGFTALSFRDPTSLEIRYRLVGYDDSWHTLADTMRRSVSYTNLPPRDYIFEVRAANGSGLWSETPARLALRIQPFWHETLWFRLLVAAALLAAFVLILQRQVGKHARREQVLERLVRERTEALEAANRRLEAMSLRDGLTGLHNRRFLADQLPSDIAHFHRCHPSGSGADMVMAFAMIDIDGFKPVNDSHGHHAGDLILTQFAQLLERQIRSGDYAVRWGGEEFLLVLRPMPKAETTRVVERIRHATEQHPFDIGGGRTLRVTCSIGVVEYPCFSDPDACLGWEQMVVLADLAMYLVKRGGRNGWALLRPTPGTPMARLLEDPQRAGIDMAMRGEIEVLCSPHLDLRMAFASGAREAQARSARFLSDNT
jgi:diguanylate cyclase (GGDEF)-like protein